MLGLFLYPVHDFLNVGRLPEPADCIFAHAGRPERKAFALQLYFRGLAPRAILSIGRYEWRSVPELGLPDDGGLAGLVQKTPPEQRHFFLRVTPGGTECWPVERGSFGTLSEARALARLLRDEGWQSVLLVSSAFHLRRARSTLRRFARPSVKIVPVAVGENLAREKREKWWESAPYATLIAAEYLKTGLYPIVSRLSS